jgi:hypothetical protein
MTIPVFCIVRAHKDDIDSSNLVSIAVSVGEGGKIHRRLTYTKVDFPT